MVSQQKITMALQNQKRDLVLLTAIGLPKRHVLWSTDIGGGGQFEWECMGSNLCVVVSITGSYKNIPYKTFSVNFVFWDMSL